MQFREFNEYMIRSMQISSRNDVTKLLGELFERVTAHEAEIVSFLILGLLRAPYEGTQFNIAEKSMKKFLKLFLSFTEEMMDVLIERYGDFGKLVEQGGWKAKGDWSIEQVYRELCKFEEISGKQSQEIRFSLLENILLHQNPEEAATIVRIILGKQRLGFSEMTIIDALSWLLIKNKSLHTIIEDAFNKCANIGTIALIAKQQGVDGFSNVNIVPGIPIRPAAAERLKTAEDIIKKIGICVAQPKIDGFRLQIHIFEKNGKKNLLFFSRNLLTMHDMFPEFENDLKKIQGKSYILEGEMIGFDDQTGTFSSFQETVKRRRKYLVEQFVEKVPLRLFLFDILYKDGISLLTYTHAERRKFLIQCIDDFASDHIVVIPEYTIRDAHELNEYFLCEIEKGNEGLVVKRPDAPYQPGKRNFNWIKLKRSEQGGLKDSIDAVILGYYFGKGKRAQFGIGAFLVGIYAQKNDQFETIAKVGTGLTDAEWLVLKSSCDEIVVSKKPHNVLCHKDLYPDRWVIPKLVVEIIADNLTKSPTHSALRNEFGDYGMALRFPRFVKIRYDKDAKEATSSQEILSLLNLVTSS